MSRNIHFHHEFVISKGNLDAAMAVLANDWEVTMTDVDRQSWADNSAKVEDVSGRALFEDHFMRGFAAVNSNVTVFATVSLGAGTSYSFADRATRTWTVG